MQKIFVLACLLCCMTFLVFAQEAEEPLPELTSELPTEHNANSSDTVLVTFDGDPNSIFVIDTINVNPLGKTITKSFALIHNLEIKIGEELHGVERLEKFIKEKTQDLVNQRVLSKGILEYTIGEARTDGKYPVHLEITIEDTWNIIALPYPKYSSNRGFDLSIRARDYNFLGTMNPLRLNLGYRYDEYERTYLDIALLADIPFQAVGFDWELTFNNYFTYRPDLDEPFYYRNTTGLSMELPWKTTMFTFGLDESLYLNDENSDTDKPTYGDTQKGPFLRTGLSASWKIPTGIVVGEYGDLNYTPSVSGSFYHEIEGYPLNDLRRGPHASISHSLGFRKIDWVNGKNYRKGLSTSASNSYNFDFFRLSKDKDYISSSYSISTSAHFPIADYFGFSTRAQFRHWFYYEPNYYEYAGDNLRGIIDKSVTADYMLSLNLDFPLRILRFMPSEWLNTNKLRLFNFEMHFSPIIDMALYHDPRTNTNFSFKNMLVSGGAEIIVFPSFMRSLYARLSFAWNIVDQINNPRDYYLNPILPIVPKFPYGNNREIFFGIGHFY